MKIKDQSTYTPNALSRHGHRAQMDWHSINDIRRGEPLCVSPQGPGVQPMGRHGVSIACRLSPTRIEISLSVLCHWTANQLFRINIKLKNPQNFPQWLSAIAKNLAVDWNKRRRPDLMEELPDVPDLSEPFLEKGNENWDILLAAIDTLEPKGSRPPRGGG